VWDAAWGLIKGVGGDHIGDLGADAASRTARTSSATSAATGPKKKCKADLPVSCGDDDDKFAGINRGLVASTSGDIYEHGGSTRYGALDSDGRATSVSSSITKATLDTGSLPLRSITPAGWSESGAVYNEARGHLLAKRLGGSGRIMNNLVTITQNPINTPLMRDLEARIHNAVVAGETVKYTATAIYGEKKPPAAIKMEAHGSGGFDLEVCIMNPAGR
jgi:hypothetical protein